MIMMMDCSDCETQLIDYACQELPEEARGDVARHLARCSACALEYCRLQADLEGIVEAHAEAPRARVFHQLRRRVAAEHGPPWWSRAWQLLMRPIPVYGAVLASLVPAALWLASTTRPEDPGGPGLDASSPSPSAAPTLTDYDATELPPAHRDVL